MEVIPRQMHPRCPMGSVSEVRRERVHPDDVLCVPYPKRLTYVCKDGGEGHLELYYGMVAVSFGGRFRAFAEELVRAGSFRAEETMEWGEASYPWGEAQELLERLLAQGILHKDKAASLRTSLPTEQEPRPRELRTWSSESDCAPLLRELSGADIEVGYLEVVVPVCRIAHPATDSDGRQIGEKEVIPTFLLRDIPTELRQCPYPGSRYQDERPMNMSALRLMMKQWDPVVALAAQMRDRIVLRSKHRGERWRVGDLHMLAVATLAAPAFLMVRGDNPTKDGELPSVLANLFRMVDGVRIATMTMLLDPGQTSTVNTEVSAEDVFNHCERQALFLGQHGVCAGTPQRIREFLEVLMGGTEPPTVSGPSLDEILGDVDAALDYAFAATQLECVVRTYLDRQNASAGRLLELAVNDGCPGPTTKGLMEAMTKVLSVNDPLRTPRSSSFHASVFEEAGRYWTAPYAFCGSLSSALGAGTARLEGAQAISESIPGMVDGAAEVISEHFAKERATLLLVQEQAGIINGLLHRAHPQRRLRGEGLQGRGGRHGADLATALTSVFGGSLERDALFTRWTGPSFEVVLRD